MGTDNSHGRRSALKQLSATLLGLVGWNVAKAATPSAEGSVFASLFLQEGASVQVPLGYDDPKTRKYLDAKTNKPIFVPEGGLTVSSASNVKKSEASNKKSAENTRIPDTELADLMAKGAFVDLMALEKLQAFGAWCTQSTLTTLSTSGCCPIVTDRTPDRVCDDSSPAPIP